MSARRALLVRGGWPGHAPVACTERFRAHLARAGYEVVVTGSLDTYADRPFMASVDLVVQSWSEGALTAEQADGLLSAVAAGAGFAGWHGGVTDAFRASPDYRFMVGGSFLCHPGGFVDYAVVPTAAGAAHPVTAGVGAFAVHTEQYYVQADPRIEVLATTTFTGDHGRPEVAGVTAPVVWVTRYGAGRVFVSTLGHAPADLDLPPVRLLTGRGLLWAARPPAAPGPPGGRPGAPSD